VDETRALEVSDGRGLAICRTRRLAPGQPAAGRVAGIAACAVSFLAVCLLTGRAALLHPGSAAVGSNPASDYQVMSWSLEWWPWAIRHGVDPLHTPLLWAPDGFSTLWMTTIPTASLLGLPITLTAGPLVAYNVLALLAAPLAAGSAYLLCRELGVQPLAALAGGLIFGLSPYMLGHTLSQHLDLILVFPLPLLALLVVRRQRGRTSSRRFVAGFAGLLVVQLGAALELFVDLTLLLFAAAVLVVAVPSLQRSRLLGVARLVGLAYALCLPLLVPLAAAMLSEPHGPLRFGPGSYSTDLLNVIVPTQTQLLGTVHAARAVSRHFVGNIGEQDGYLGLPLLVVAALALRREWRRGAWLIGALLAVALALSFGPTLAAAGRPLASMPVSLGRLPLLEAVLPARMAVFVALGAAALCALWLGRPGRPALRLAAASLVALSLLPAFWSPSRFADSWSARRAFGWSTPHVSRGFLAAPGWRRVLPQGTTVLVLPAGDRSAAGFWQAASGMRFRLAVPATPFAPPRIAAAPLVSGLVNSDLPALEGAQLGGARLRAFLLARHIGAVAVEGDSPRWNQMAAVATGASPLVLGSTRVYRVRRGLPPLRVIGAWSTARAGRFRATAFLRFDGHHSAIHVAVRGGGRRPLLGLLSAPGTDAAWTTAGVDARGRAAFAFTEWRPGRLLLRAARRIGGRWRLQTLERTTQPIWTPKVVVTGGGRIVVTWVDQVGALRSLRAAVAEPGRPWSQPVTLERAEGLGGAELVARGNGAVCAWSDTRAGESRVRVAVLGNAGWTGPRTYATSMESIRAVTLSRRGTRVRWIVQESLASPRRVHQAPIGGAS
jgi:hypothetical protein